MNVFHEIANAVLAHNRHSKDRANTVFLGNLQYKQMKAHPEAGRIAVRSAGSEHVMGLRLYRVNEAGHLTVCHKP